MKSAAFLLCLLVATRAGAAEPSVSDERGNQRPRPTPEYRIREVRFAGDPAFDTDALKQVLKELKVRRWMPGVWTRRPRYDARALDADLARLRSFYLSNGYFHARVGIGDVTFDGREATITLQVASS
jgi:outer membrane protein assembly factor BamA